MSSFEVLVAGKFRIFGSSDGSARMHERGPPRSTLASHVQKRKPRSSACEEWGIHNEANEEARDWDEELNMEMTEESDELDNDEEEEETGGSPRARSSARSERTPWEEPQGSRRQRWRQGEDYEDEDEELLHVSGTSSLPIEIREAKVFDQSGSHASEVQAGGGSPTSGSELDMSPSRFPNTGLDEAPRPGAEHGMGDPHEDDCSFVEGDLAGEAGRGGFGRAVAPQLQVVVWHRQSPSSLRSE